MDFTSSDLQVQISQYRCRIVFTEIADLQNGLAQIGVSEPFKRVVTGVVIVLAVVLDRWRADRSF